MLTDYANVQTSKNPGVMAFLNHLVPEIINEKNMHETSNVDQLLEVDIHTSERAIWAKRKEWWKKYGIIQDKNKEAWKSISIDEEEFKTKWPNAYEVLKRYEGK